MAKKQIGPYTLLGELGRGGMGVVYRVRRDDLKREFALKVMLKPDDPKAVERFLREARAAAALSSHPGIVAVHDVGEAEDGTLYLAMDRVKGLSLDLMIDEVRLLPSEWARTVGHAAEAIHFAHIHGILHRDIKPGNILVDGEAGRARVTDFGLAFRSDDTKLTNSGDIVGTPAYMPPEQATGDPLDERADVWSLGATLYECLTGHPPFDGATALNVLTAIMTKEPRRMVGLPRDLVAITMKCLEKEPDRRYPSALALAQDIGRFIDGKPVIAKPAGIFDRLRKRVKRNPMATGALVLAATVTALGSAVVGFQHLQAQAQQEAVTQAFIDAGDTYHAAYQDTEGREREENYISAWSAYQGAHRLLAPTPTHPAYGIAEKALADMAWGRLKAAEAHGIHGDAARFESDLRKYGARYYPKALRGDGILSLDTYPSGATVECYRYVNQGGRLVEEIVTNTQTPVNGLSLPMGSYLLIIKKKGYRDTRYPVLIERLEQEVIQEPIPLYTDNQIGRGFIYVPEGESLFGSDPVASEGWERHKKWVGGFAISEFEVTFEEYGRFLLDLLRSGRAGEVKSRLPRQTHGKLFVAIKDDGLRGTGFVTPDQPVMGITWHDAVAFCEWLSVKQGRTVTLLSEVEWARAAFGADGRIFPWGSEDNPEYRVTMNWAGNEGLSAVKLYPVGTASLDRSPFGVRDLAGSVKEWLSDSSFSRRKGAARVRGGDYLHERAFNRPTTRGGILKRRRSDSLGFRVRTQPKK